MNITIKKILEEQKKLLNEYHDNINFKDKLVRDILEQREMEYKMVKYYESCPSQIQIDIIKHLSSLEPEGFKEELETQFYNHNVMEAVACFLNSLVYSQTYITPNERLQKYIDSLKILANRNNTTVLKASIVDYWENDIFILKSPTDIKGGNNTGSLSASSNFSNENFEDIGKIDIIHETIIGLYGTNKLRKLIPNFSYVYGPLNCSSPLIQNDKVVTWCDTSNDTFYVVYENIEGISLKEYCNKTNIEDFMLVFMQILHALRIAEKECGFTHYDLHSENVILKKLDKEYLVPYDDLYIKTNMIATIIDYGKSHIIYDKQSFGDVGDAPFVEFDIRRDKTNIVYDVFKLLCFCIRDMGKIGEQLLPLLKYFNKNDKPQDFFKNMKKLYFFIPYELGKNFNITDFMKYCLDFMPNLRNKLYKKPEIGDNILNCKDNSCYTFIEALKEGGLNINDPISEPKNIFQFYDTYNLISDTTERDLYFENFINNVDIDKINIDLRSLVDTMKKSQNTSTIVNNSINQKVGLTRSTVDKIITNIKYYNSIYNTLLFYQNIIDDILALKEDIDILKSKEYLDKNILVYRNDIDQYNNFLNMYL